MITVTTYFPESAGAVAKTVRKTSERRTEVVVTETMTSMIGAAIGWSAEYGPDGKDIEDWMVALADALVRSELERRRKDWDRYFDK